VNDQTHPQPAAPTLPVTVHLVPHTHWDREWYEPFQSFRMRLVDLVDDLLERLEDPRFAFTLDGQLATVDDYLEVRPEREGRIRELVAEGRLAVGPWLILMDEFHVSGENMVRNLELGWRRAEALGARPMPVGYLPDMFGHIAQMPQMLRRAGIDQAVVWRGIPAAIDRHVFRWRSPDGSEVTAEYLVGGYGQAAYLLAIPDRLAAKVAAYHDQMRPFYGDTSVLAMYGTDHAAPLPGLVDLVDDVNAAQDGYRMRIETLAEYIAGRDGRDAAIEWTGELRSGARANVLMSVTSARIDIKQACGRAERGLERYAEPLQALHGGAWPADLLRIAWRKVVENSAHDSICGCSVDPVVAQVLSRFAEAEQIAGALARRAAAAVAARVPVGQSVALNPSPMLRRGIVELDMPIPDEWAAVTLVAGTAERVGTQELRRTRPLVHEQTMRGAEVATFLGRRLHGRELFGRMVNGVRIEREDDRPTITIEVDDEAHPAWLDIDELRTEIDVAVASAPDATWLVRTVARPRRTVLGMVAAPALGWVAVEPAEGATPVPDAVRASERERELDNGLIRVSVEDAGTLAIAGGGATLTGVGRIVEGGDFGDTYNYGPPPGDVIVDAPVDVTVDVRERGPVRGELVVTRTYDWPLGVTPDGRGRVGETARVAVRTHVELRAGERFVRVRVAFDNPASDHRVRFHVPLPQPADHSSAEGQFAVVDRGLTVEGGHGEVPLPTFPARGFVNAGDAALLLDHVTEYELVDGRELAVTLLRSTGLISRNDNPYREDPAGPERPTPAAQLHGPWSMGFAILPHAGTWVEAGVVKEAELYQHGFVAAPGRETGLVEAEPQPMPEGAGLSIEGDGVVLSSLRRRDDRLELRLVAQHPDGARAIVRGAFAGAREADLLGRPGAELPLEAGALRLDLGPWEIRTVQLAAREGH
jgi:mannosylglycerate hydrolase